MEKTPDIRPPYIFTVHRLTVQSVGVGFGEIMVNKGACDEIEAIGFGDGFGEIMLKKRPFDETETIRC